MTLQKIGSLYLATFHGTIGTGYTVSEALRMAYNAWQRILALRAEVDAINYQDEN